MTDWATVIQIGEKGGQTAIRHHNDMGYVELMAVLVYIVCELEIEPEELPSAVRSWCAKHKMMTRIREEDNHKEDADDCL